MKYTVTLNDDMTIDFTGTYEFSGDFVVFHKEQEDGSIVSEVQSLAWVKKITKNVV